MDFLDIIKNRRSCRKYAAEQIADDELLKVLEAGTWAPTARGLQAPYIVAVQDKALIEQLTRMNAEVMGVKGNPYYGAPTYVLVFAPDGDPNGLQDGSLVLGNMMLAAYAIGLGSCWINREREMFASEEGKALMKKMGLPDGLMGVGALSLGYPLPENKPVKPRKADYFRIIK